MNRYYYDLHIHSCLSPCGDEDMTPNNIVGMGILNGLNIMALTDHNTCKNCPAFYKAAERQGIIPVVGMELTTAEDIHAVCLFPQLESAMEFDLFVQNHRILIPNRTDIFGFQYITDENDKIIGEELNLLSNATDIMIDDAYEIVSSFGGICYPAHVDRESNSIIATLGIFPEYSSFEIAEFNNRNKIDEYNVKYPSLNNKIKIVSSDAHYLWNIKEKNDYFEIDDEPYNSEIVRKRLFEILGGEK